MGRIRIASLFCGCGGTDVGLMGGFNFNNRFYNKLNTEIVYANDIEDAACDMFDANFEIAADRRDVKEVLPDEIPEFDVLVGGFPCQSFSIVAQNPKRLGVKDDKGQLFFEMCRILKEKQPPLFIAENVRGILSANKGEAFPLIMEEFTNCGYRVNYGIMEAVKYGVPQKRVRVIIYGVRKDLPIDFKLPEPILSEKDYVPLQIALEANVPEKYYFSKRAVEGMLRSRHKMNKGRAQDPEQPCNTVGAHLAKVSLNSTDPVFMENGRYRRFTPREVARIQSFPEEFLLVGSDSAQYRALGNAIPPLMFWYVGGAIEEFFHKLKQLEF